MSVVCECMWVLCVVCVHVVGYMYYLQSVISRRMILTCMSFSDVACVFIPAVP